MRMNAAQRWIIAWAVLFTTLLFVYAPPAGRTPPSPLFTRGAGAFYLVLALFVWRGGARHFERHAMPADKRALALKLCHVTGATLVVSWLITTVTGTFALRWLGALSLIGGAATEYVEAGTLPEAEAEKWAKRARLGVILFALLLVWMLRER